LRIRTVRGPAYQIGDRTLVPEARVVAFGKGSATIGSRQHFAWGGGFAQITPVAMVEQTAAGEVRIAIQDNSAAAVRGILLLTVATTLLLTMIRWLAGSGARAGGAATPVV
jgi:hypothetical protein